MRHILFFISCSVLLIAGCQRKGPELAETKRAEPTGKAALIEMSVTAQQHIGLVDTPAAKTQLNEYLRVTGTVQPMDSRVGSVRSFARGRVVEVRAKVGDRVAAGQVLATVDNIEAGELLSQLQSARAEQERLNAQLVPAKRQTERARHLADIGASPEKDYEFSKAEQEGIESNIRAQQALIDGLRLRLRRFGVAPENSTASLLAPLRAPFSGVVTKAQSSPGDYLDESKEAFAVADLSRVWVQAEVYEKDLGRIRVGQESVITVDTYPGEDFQGRVRYISDVLDPQTRTARVRCVIENVDLRLKTDMFANIELPTKFSKLAIAVPSSALQQVEGKSVVFIRRSPTQFEKREVKTGVTINQLTEIVSGLKGDEPVVTQGAFHLKSILAGGELGEE